MDEAVLRARMAELATSRARVRSGAVIDAMRSVPRHAFVPDAAPEVAYSSDIVVIKRDTAGEVLSCASAPSIVAMMLDQLDIRPGHRVLEIGAGTGYNAALLAQLAGPTGSVTTVDLDPEITAHARRALDATGYHNVRVVTGDGVLADPSRAPYDRISVTVSTWDIPTSWYEQLAPAGRLVVPLRWRGQTRCVAFTPHRSRLEAATTAPCGFVPMVGQAAERSGHVDPGRHVELIWDPDQTVDLHALTAALAGSPTARWSGVTVGPQDPFDGIWLNLSLLEPGTCRVRAGNAAVEAGARARALPVRGAALVEADGLAYLTGRWLADRPPQSTYELGAAGYGPAGVALAERYCEHIRSWNADRCAQPSLTAHRRDRTPTVDPLARARSRHRTVIDKHTTRLVLTGVQA